MKMRHRDIHRMKIRLNRALDSLGAEDIITRAEYDRIQRRVESLIKKQNRIYFDEEKA